MKRVAVFSFFAFGIQVIQAGSMGLVCNSQNVIMCPGNYWDLGITALYSQLGTASNLLNPYLNVPVGTPLYHVKSPWDWGFILEGSYHFNTENDFNLNWLHFSNAYPDRFTRLFPDVGTGFSNLRTTHAQFDTSLDAVNLELAQGAHFAKKTTIRFHGGLQYAQAKIIRNVSEFETINDIPEFTFQTTEVSTQFEGIGPRVGMDMAHDLHCGFKVFAQGAVALLSSKGKAKLSGTNRSGLSATVFARLADQNILVPEFDARLGASYDWNLTNGQVSLSAGWLFQHYFNMLLLPPGEALNPARSLTSHNLSLNGPFIRGKWVTKT